MTIAIGTRLGSYEILSPLGAGGMGEVYRARDTRLNRDVAIKSLPAALANDADRGARFRREAQLLASLNHPHIAAIYGFEEIGDAQYLVLELVEGETLDQKLRHGSGLMADGSGTRKPLAMSHQPSGGLSVEDTLTIARQIVDALEAAHARGIIHRDLKPANIKIRPDGTVKVLDFGLAKALGVVAAEAVPAAEHGNTPTVALAGSAPGMILGTVSYMSPEQAKGREADQRSDVWSFGCVLFEMLSGKPPFPGETTADVIAAVMHIDPNWAVLSATVPAAVRRLLRRCLQKDPRKRLHDIADARLELDEPPESTAPLPVTAASPARHARSAIVPWTIAGVLAVVAIAATLSSMRPRSEPPKSPVRATIPLPSSSTLFLSRGSAVAVSADGHRLAYLATTGSKTQIHVRAIDTMDARALDGTEGAADPFFSPDAQWIGFFADGKLKKISTAGGAAITLAEAPNPRGQTWGADDAIYFTPRNNAGVWKIPSGGGTPQEITKVAQGEFSHRWPQIIAGGRAILFTIWNDRGFEAGRVAVQPLPAGERKILVDGGSYPRIFGPDSGGRSYLVYAQAEGLAAAPFDSERLALAGPPAPVLGNVTTNLSGGAHLGVSNDGLLAYIPGSLGETEQTLLWVDRQGREKHAAQIKGLSLFFRLSPDGRQVARNNNQGAARDIWIDNLERGTSTRFTFGGNNPDAVWSRDGKWIAYATGLPNMNLYLKRADGGGEAERLTTSPNAHRLGSFAPDGRTLAFIENDPVTGTDIWTIPLDGDRKPRVFLRTPFNENYPDISPDGRWLAYTSNESGRFEIYVAAFPEGGRKIQISADGGSYPLWSHSGRELFYQSGRKIMAASIAGASELTAERTRTLIDGRYEGVFGVAADDQQFLLIKSAQDSAATQIYLVLNWFEDLKRLVPAK